MNKNLLLTGWEYLNYLKTKKKEKIFGVGLSRTGTKSLNVALNLLGFKAIHFPVRMVRLKGETLTCVHQTISSFDAATDTPVAAFYRHLDRKYPNAKFILTIRNTDEWLESCADFFRTAATKYPRHSQIKKLLRKKIYGTTVFEEKKFRLAYDKHIQDIKKYFENKKDKLLVINICAGEYWDRLAPFLEKVVPKIAFPRENIRK